MTSSLSKYDLVVKCDNLRDLNTNGWPVLVRREMFISRKENYMKVIAISGCYNVGKSFVLNNLGAMDLPSSDRVHTEGLSVRLLNNNIALIDTAGTNSPIKVADQQSLSDRICMEKVLANCLRELADFHICVVNKLTWQDQQHYEMLFDTIDHTTKLWPLVIIHNYRDNSLEDLKNSIEEFLQHYPNGKMKTSRMDEACENAKTKFIQQIEEILDSYKKHKQHADEIDIKEQEISKFKPFNLFERKGDTQQIQPKGNGEVVISSKKYVELLRSKFCQDPMIWFDSRGNDKCRHFFLVKNEGAGQLFNFKTFTHIKEIFAQAIAKSRTFCIENIRVALDTHTRRYLRFENMDQVYDYNNPILELVDPAKNQKSSEIVEYCIVLKDNLRRNPIKLKDPYELEYHTLYLGATQWNPRYDIVYEKTEKTEYCWVVIELPGQMQDELDYDIDKDSEGNKITITFSGQPIQEKFYLNGKVIKGQQPERQFTRFDFKVLIPGDYDSNIDNPEEGNSNGVYWIGLEKRPKQFHKKFGKNK